MDYAQQLVREAEKLGGEAEVFRTRTYSSTVFLDRNEFLVAQQHDYEGFGLRVLHQKKVGFAASTAAFPAADVVRRALAAAKQNKAVKGFSFASKNARTKTRVDKAIQNAANEPENLKKYCSDFAREANGFAIPIAQFKSAIVEFELSASNGLNARGELGRFDAEAYLIAKKSGARAEIIRPFSSGKLNEKVVAGLVGECTRLASDSLGAKPVPSGAYDVIMAPRELSALLSQTVGAMASGRSLVEKTSIFQGKVGKRVYDERFSLLDSQTLTGSPLSVPFDQEGVARGTRAVFEKGVFDGFLFDRYYAALAGKQSTGNGRRASGDVETWFAASPSVDLNTFEVGAGDATLSELIEETKRGVLVERTGWPLADEASGKFSLEVRNGQLIENGEIVRPFKSTLVAGSMYDLLRNSVRGFSKERAFASSSSSAWDAVGLCPYAAFSGVQVASA